MTRRTPPRLPLELLERYVPDSAPLSGDLQEEFHHGRSRLWLWWQVAGAVACAAARGRWEIRPLRLTETQPADAVERSRRLMLRFRAVNITASPIHAIGGLGLLVIAMVVWPAWPLVLAFLTVTLIGGGLAAFVLIERRSLPRGWPDPFADLRTGSSARR
jgi:hypothetical protein